MNDRSQLYSDICEAQAILSLAGQTLIDHFGEETGIELTNFISAIDHAHKQDTPAKDWWHCEPNHAAVYRALGIDPKEEGAFYACLPFRLFHDGEKHVILAAYPCPRVLGPVDMDWLDIEDVIAWDPVTDTAELRGVGTDLLAGPEMAEETNTLFASPREFLTEWAMRRAQFSVQRQALTEWQDISEHDVCPGKLAIGDINKIRWSGLSADFEARGFDIPKLNRAILRGANIPRAFDTQMRAVA